MQPSDLQISTTANTTHVLEVQSMDRLSFCCYVGLTSWCPT